MRPRHVVALFDHSDHRADSRCPCGPEPVRDLAEPAAVVYLHRRPIPEVSAVRRADSRRPVPSVAASTAGGPSRTAGITSRRAYG
jgi:hypothetical protein